MPNLPFSVILANPEARDFMKIAKALAAVRKTPLQDQISLAKSSWGILADNLDEQAAQSFVKGLRENGLDSTAIPSSGLIRLPEAQGLTRWDPQMTEGLLLMGAAGLTVMSTRTKTVKEGPSTTQKILSTGILLTTGLPIKIGGKDRLVEKTQAVSDLVFYLELIYQGIPRRRRIDAQRFDYACLKDRKQYHLLGNFKALLGDLAKLAPGAWRNHGARVLMEGKPMQSMGYDSLADVERECRWLLALQTLA